jgi:hypothetical protein
MLTADRVEEFLKGDGWPLERVDRNTWRSGFRGDVNSFRFYVRLTDNWIFFTIVPFVVAPRSDDRARELYRHLLRLNRRVGVVDDHIGPRTSDAQRQGAANTPRGAGNQNRFPP